MAAGCMAMGIFEEVDENAVKRVMTWQIEQEMKKQGLTTAAVAAKMHTSRASLKRTLDPKNTSVTLNTLIKIAQVLGKQLKIELV